MDKSSCALDGCEHPSEGRGWCRGHYQRIKRNGEPGPVQFRRSPNSEPHPCGQDGCDDPAMARGWCATHYSRWYYGGDMDAPVRRLTKAPTITCKIDECDDQATAQGWCNRHYQRWYRTGDPGPADLPRIGLVEVCTAPGCERRHRTKGWCDMHYRRAKAGIPTNSLKFLTMPKPRRDEVSYHIAHGHIVAERGRAGAYTCACGETAKDWAYQHNDPDASTDERGYLYSLKFYECYEPMCRSCHNLLDRDADRRAAATT